MSAEAWPDEVAPPPFTAETGAVPLFASAFCPVCRGQVMGPDVETVALDLVTHVSAVHA